MENDEMKMLVSALTAIYSNNHKKHHTKLQNDSELKHTQKTENNVAQKMLNAKL